MIFEVGKSYKTVGGWKATVIWKYENSQRQIFTFPYIAIHFLKSELFGNIKYDTQLLLYHQTNGNYSPTFSINDIDRFSISENIKFPPDLTEEEWSDK